MRILNTILSVSLFLLTSCYIDYKAHDQHDDSPRIQDAEAACWWNPSYQDYVWSFDILVSHPDGSSEISDVFVDIYQLSYLGTLYLLPDMAGYWRLVIDERETPLWCGDFYEMEVVAYDWDGNWDALGLSPGY